MDKLLLTFRRYALPEEIDGIPVSPVGVSAIMPMFMLKGGENWAAAARWPEPHPSEDLEALSIDGAEPRTDPVEGG